MVSSSHHIADSMSDMLEGLRSGGGPSWVEQYMLELQELKQKQNKNKKKNEQPGKKKKSKNTSNNKKKNS
jgi:hypothetical protein